MSRASRRNPAYLQPVPRADLSDAEDPDTPPSKSQRKREVNALQTLGAALEALPKDRLANVPLPDPLADALREARRITSHEGKRRHLQYVGKLMRGLSEAEIHAIRRALAASVGADAVQTARLHAIERWRDRLIASDDAITAFIATHAPVDVQALRARVRNARREAQQAKPPKAARELFQMIKHALDQPDHAAIDNAARENDPT